MPRIPKPKKYICLGIDYDEEDNKCLSCRKLTPCKNKYSESKGLFIEANAGRPAGREKKGRPRETRGARARRELMIQRELREKFPQQITALDSPAGFMRKLGSDGRVIYSEEERLYLIHMANIDRNIALSAKVNNVPYHTLKDMVSRPASHAAEKYGDIKGILDDFTIHKVMEGIDVQLSQITDREKAENASLGQNATAFGISIDKLFKILGEPDQRIQTNNVTQIQELKVVLDGLRSNPQQFVEFFQTYRGSKGKLKPPIDN